jgi:carnitine-CoA ligase
MSDPAGHASLVHAFIERAGAQPDSVFASFDGRPALAMGETAEAIRRFANALHDHGLAPGDRLLVALDNSPEFLIAWMGSSFAGVAMVPLVPDAGERLYERALAVGEPRLAVAGARGTSRLEAVGARERLELVSVDDASPGALAPEFERLIAAATPASDNLATELGTASIMFTSGTTGPPKGVCLSHLWYMWASEDLVAGMSYGPSDHLYSCLPLGHANAQDTTLGPALLSGAKVTFDRRFSASRHWHRLRDVGATAFNMIGNMPRVLLNRDESEFVPDHGAGRSFSIPALPHYRDEFASRFGVALWQGYGSTEIGVPVFQDEEGVRRGSAGLPVDGTELMIARPDGTPADVGETGEIWARSTRPGAFTEGYFRDPERTAAAWTDGWFRCGDLGRLDEDGHLYFAGRLGDRLRRKGENLSAHDVESVVMELDFVAECAAISRPSQDGDDEIVVFVVPAEGRAVDAAAVSERCAAALGRAAEPSEVRSVDALPRTESGKVAKGVLREQQAVA